MQERVRRHTPQTRAKIKTRADGETISSINGYGAVFYRDGDPSTEYWLWSDTVERIMPGAFDNVLADNTRGLFNHDPNYLLASIAGGTMRQGVDQTGLWYEMSYDANDPDHVRVGCKLQRGDVTGSSFAFSVDEAVWRELEDGIWAREIVKVGQLYDQGPVVYPAYDGTSAGTREDLRLGDEKRALSWFSENDIAEARSSLENHRRDVDRLKGDRDSMELQSRCHELEDELKELN